jgi:hypothetical protein
MSIDTIKKLKLMKYFELVMLVALSVVLSSQVSSYLGFSLEIWLATAIASILFNFLILNLVKTPKGLTVFNLCHLIGLIVSSLALFSLGIKSMFLPYTILVLCLSVTRTHFAKGVSA